MFLPVTSNFHTLTDLRKLGPRGRAVVAGGGEGWGWGVPVCFETQRTEVQIHFSPNKNLFQKIVKKFSLWSYAKYIVSAEQ